MKRWIAALTLLAMLLGPSVGARADEASGGEAIRHRVLQTGKADQYSVYQIVDYGEDTHTLKAVTIITRFPADSGITEEIAGSFDVEQAYPGIDEMDFVRQELYSADDGSVLFAVRFDALDDAGHKKIMVERGYLLAADPSEVLTSDKYVKSLSQYGTVGEVPPVDYEKLGFHFE